MGKNSKNKGKAAALRVPWEIITRIERAPDAAALKARLVESAALFGFSSIFAGRVPPAEPHLEAEAVASQLIVSTMPDSWEARYFERGYVFRDPIVERLRMEHAPFTWEDAYQTCREPTNVSVIRGESSEFGLRTGFVVPIILLGGLQIAFSFGASAYDAAPDVLSTLSFITNFIAGRLLDLAGLSSSQLRVRGPGNTVTSRERDCLAWSAEGKTDWEIAAILGISVPTVRKHLASARDKLEAVNKYHAVAIGFRKGLLK